jgi:signal transduction histidine kinase
MNDIILSIVSATLLILLLIAGIAITFFISGRQRMRQEQVLVETKLSFEQELRQVEKDVSKLITEQFTSDLHDNIGQLLTVMHIEIEKGRLDFPERSDHYKLLGNQLDQVMGQLRVLTKTLNDDLQIVIRLEVNRMQDLKLFKVFLDDKEYVISDLKKDHELMIFRIFQEIFQNIIKHAKAEHVRVRLKANAGLFELEVSDDGKGFDYEQVIKKNNGSGLLNIRKRASIAQLECVVQSKPGEGTRYFLKKSPN